MDRERTVVRQLADIEFEMMVQCFEVVHISDNCKSQRCNHASCAPFRVAVETIEPKSNTSKLFIHSNAVIWRTVHKEC